MINALDTVSDYDLQIGDKKLTDDQKLDIVEISFEEKIGYTSCVRVVIRDSDEMSLAFDDLKFGTSVIFSLGWFGDKQTLFAGSIVSVGPAFKANAPSQIEVTAYDQSFNLKEPRDLQFLHGDSLYRMVRRILEDHKNLGHIDDYVIAHRQNVLQQRIMTIEEAGFQFEQTDFEMLTKIAARTGYVILNRWSDGAEQSVFYFVEPEYFCTLRMPGGLALASELFMANLYHAPLATDLDDPKGLIIYSFDPEMRQPGQKTDVKVITYASVDAKGNRFGASNLGDLRVNKGERDLTRVQIESSKVSVLTIFGEVAKSDGDAKILAAAELDRRARELVTGQVTMNGWVPLRAGQRHNFTLRALKTFGTAFSGQYNITGVKHSFTAGQGFRTKCDVSRHVMSEPNK